MIRDHEYRHLRGLAALAGAVAHKMNNDLAGITCNLSMILADFENGEQPDDTPELISDALLAAQHAAHLLQSAFSLFRMDDAECEPIDLNETLQLVVTSTVQQDGLDIEIEFDLAATTMSVHSTAERIQRIVAPLLVNAAESVGPSGRVVVRSALREAADGDTLDPLEPATYAVVSIVDSGTGMDPKLGVKAFEPFITTKERGRGLGLSVSLALARSHGGTIGMGRPAGGGAELLVWLPLV
ncbi:MAG: sensor histidine kinase [Myxococcota bacterium]